MPFLLALLLCGVVPDDVWRYKTDCIELNHVVSVRQDNGGEWVASVSLSQVIFWHLGDSGTAYVRDWRTLKDCERPRYDHRQRVYRCTWTDRSRRLVEVTAPSFFESWTLTDPEVENRKIRPIKERWRIDR